MMAHKKVSNENIDAETSKKMEQLQTFVCDFRNQVETKVGLMRNAIEQDLVKIESYFKIKKSEISEETLKMKFSDYLAMGDTSYTEVSEIGSLVDLDKNKNKFLKKQKKALDTAKKRKRNATATKASKTKGKDAVAVDADTVEASSSNILDILSKKEIDISTLDIPAELINTVLKNVKRIEKKLQS